MRNWESLLGTLIYILAALIAALAVVQLVVTPFRLGSQKSSGHALSSIDSFRMTKLKPLEAYKSDFASHALFSKLRVAVVPKGPTIDDLLKQYSINGIIQGAVPDVLIMNNRTRQTQILSAGQSFDQFKIIQIKQHSIMVEYQGQQKELFIAEGQQ
ncbi:MAG: hypothetical protein A3G33_04390 [Omnitrophica bacterium RIFCSPLOWO2_12_FULL_44_17]|uniref:Type II secretion system protein GspC N-terminal domain-containing protein n=1 Tax=Candidatus Danuiimicrobium aquiferis TaxID=1801832 RepID=A0A1G1KQH3_9BACT|nr:MAG: hypothetical protein A3B72_10600 [Omnitrophica bacterium RIFCSPHIGHO2_02_FULL_45_28]OGW92463.1 MAG: hypothetical protein A3E74_03915 [Omnitrophica bacterium RIFCSPHIGHO2_12_FULL_44_12]OGW95173.1 MAG: hypothetical protein A3G33_04390 [Omnitrophica bacterium RIFCSPLOWO2_12_FULL_44_17]OGX01682.1 MAG: hypothetical protein A3J12_04045 [Omnitrophica bacterium RIFCSPLOWO2_02_FULL_44_11]